MQFTIEYIKALHNIPLSQNCSPIDERQCLWSRLLGRGIRELEGAKYPAAFKTGRKKGKKSRLKVKVKIQDFKPGLYRLEGLVDKVSIFSSKEKKVKKPDVEFKVQDTVKPFNFHRFEGEVIWRLTRLEKNKKTKYDGITTYLELYWLYGYNNKLFRPGVPVEILRQAAYELRIQKVSKESSFDAGSKTKGNRISLKDPIINAIASTCFFRTPPRYDVLTGGDSFFLETRGSHRCFLLRKYIMSLHDCTARCNCSDMAAVVQIHLEAIGIKKVLFCYINTPFYLRISNVVGRGFCNNPKYISHPDNNRNRYLVVDENHPKRDPFGSHVFCCIPDVDKDVEEYIGSVNLKDQSDSCRVLDACFGPHNGNGGFDVYVKKIVDNDTPGRPTIQDPTISTSKGVTETDFIKGKEGESNFPDTTVFKDLVNYTEIPNVENEFFLVYSWSTPLEFLDLDDEWEIFYEQIIPGTHEVMKTWKLKKKDNRCKSIQVDFHVFSCQTVCEASQQAQYCFLVKGSTSTHLPLPYENWPSGPGLYSAMHETEEYGKYLWTKFNTTVCITCQDINLKAEALSEWGGHKFAKKIKEDEDIKKHLPLLEDNIHYKDKIGVGETVDVEIKSQEDVFIDFVFEDSNDENSNGLHLISIEDKKLTFTAVEKSKNRLIIVVVNRDTLLTNSKEITIVVDE